MSYNRGRRPLPDAGPTGSQDPDVQMLYDRLQYHGVLDIDPVDPRDGDMWVLDAAAPELRIFIRRPSAVGKKYRVALTEIV